MSCKAFDDDRKLNSDEKAAEDDEDKTDEEIIIFSARTDTNDEKETDAREAYLENETHKEYDITADKLTKFKIHRPF